MDEILILGTGLAGYTLAREIRALDTRVTLRLITADSGDFYSKPMLSTSLRQGRTAQTLVSTTMEEMSERVGLTVESRCLVDGFDTRERRVTTSYGERRYHLLVLALGAHPVIPELQGDAAEDRLTINNLDDYGRFRLRLPDAPAHIAIIGPGLIGCEFANDLLSAGHGVTLIGPDPHPISTLLPPATGQALQAAMATAGASWRLGATATAMEHAAYGYRLTLNDGTLCDCDLVLSAVGLRPEVALATSAGLAVNRGITTDRLLRTSDPRIYAIGDCAEVDGRNLPFVMPIMHCARALAKTLTGSPTAVAYPPMPVVIKTPLHPVVAAPPERGSEGEWQIEADDGGTRCLFHGPDGRLQGFVLSGSFMHDKQALTAALTR